MVYIHVLTYNNANLTLDIKLSDTITMLKEKIREKINIEIENQCLFWGGKNLSNDQKTLTEYDIKPESSLLLLAEDI